MEKEEILARSRQENGARDLVEAEVLAKANSIALWVGIMVCGVLTILHSIFADAPDFGVWTVYFSALATVMLVKFAKLRKGHELALGLFYLGLSLAFFVLYLYHMGVF